MNRWLRLFAAAATVAGLGLTASIASAGSGPVINFSWDNCTGDGGVADKTFGCTTNSGTNIAHGSYIAPAGVDTMAGNDIVIDLISNSNPLPPWWNFKNTGTCRATALSSTADFSSATNCLDYWQGQAGGGLASYFIGQGPVADPWVNPQRARMIIAWGVAASSQGAITGGQEYGSFQMRISNAKSTGTGSCAGCLDPVCIVLNEIRLSRPGGTRAVPITTPGVRNSITWQGGAGANCAVVPVKNATWGQIKSLYR